MRVADMLKVWGRDTHEFGDLGCELQYCCWSSHVIFGCHVGPLSISVSSEQLTVVNSDCVLTPNNVAECNLNSSFSAFVLCSTYWGLLTIPS